MSATKICPQCSAQYEDDQRFCPLDGSTLKSLSAASDLVGSVIADRYHVIRKLGEGGMGQVYLAEHVRMGRKSAVKVMNPGMVHDPDAISRFNREAANASRITHPNVAAIYDFGETSDGLIYLAMEYVDGEPLTQLIAAGPLPAARAASIVRQTGDALAVSHDFGIVHRDLKPDNIMVARNRDSSDCVKVVDFGIAKAANVERQKVTRTGLIVGTPEYMSPEQLAGDALDGRSDIYSLALVGFSMLTGKLPFPSDTVQESMIMRLTDRPRSLAEMKPDVAWPPQLQAVMDRALSRDAGSRYSSAAEFGHDFAAAVERMPRTVASEASTSILAASAVPATSVSPAPTRIGPTQPEARSARRRAPVLIGAATIGVGAIIAFGVLRGNGAARSGSSAAPRPTDDSSAPAARRGDSAGVLPNVGGRSAASPSPAGSTRPTGPAATTAGAQPRSSSSEQTLSPEAIRAEIVVIKNLSLDDQRAAEAVRRAEALLPSLRTGDDSAAVLWYQGSAYAMQGDTTRSCRALKKIGARGNSSIRESVNLLRSQC